jgi:hypothetical protein
MLRSPERRYIVPVPDFRVDLHGCRNRAKASASASLERLPMRLY